jgi:uncharacterized membrane protein
MKMSNKAFAKTNRMVGVAIFAAMVVVLQLVATYIKFGPFAITLALTPIVVGAALYGSSAGLWLGGAFGAVVLAACITGGDPGGAYLWSVNPFFTAVICLGKALGPGSSRRLYTPRPRRKTSTRASCSPPCSARL